MERVEGVEGRTDGQVGEGEGCVAVLLEGLWLPAGTVLVLGMVLHVLGPDPFGLVDEGPLLGLGQQFPLGAQPAGDL